MTVVSIEQKEKESAMLARITDPNLRGRVIAAQQYAQEKYTLLGTWKKVAAALGVGNESTLIGFVTGSYPASPANIVTSIERARAREEERSLSSFTPEFVQTSIARTIAKVVRQTRARGQLGTLSGESGLGKTLTIRQIVAADPSIVHVPCNPTINARLWPVLALIFRHLAGAATKLGSAPFQAYEALCERLVDKARMLIIDEAQQILRPQIFDTLRCLSDDTGTPILFVGNKQLYEFSFLGSATEAAFTQFTRRCAVSEHLAAKKVTKGDVTLICAQRLDQDVLDETLDSLIDVARGKGAFGALHLVLQRAHEKARGERISAAQVFDSIAEAGGGAR